MAIGTITRGDGTGEKPSTPSFFDPLSFLGDDSYTTGGTLAFEASYRAAMLGNRQVIAVISGDCGLHVAVYDAATDALKVYLRSTGAEVANAVDLSSVTFNLVVISK